MFYAQAVKLQTSQTDKQAERNKQRRVEYHSVDRLVTRQLLVRYRNTAKTGRKKVKMGRKTAATTDILMINDD